MALASGQCRTKELEAAGSPRRPWRRRLRVKRQFEPDGGRAPRADDQPPALRRRGGDASRRLRWATEGSARCLGRDDIGTIAPGKQADLALFTLDELRFSAPTIRSPRSCSAARIAPTG